MTPIDILLAGLQALQEYLSAHVLTCLIPAFFIAGAIAVFVSKQSVLKYFGAQTKKYISYSVASISGTILAVCSCTVLPLFAGIYKRGAGIGPATTFLFSGPAINVLAIILTARVLGFSIGLARIIGAVSMSIVIGLIMALIFKEHDTKNKEQMNAQGLDESGSKRSLKVSMLFFISLVLILVVGAAGDVPLIWKFAVVYFLTILVSVLLIFYYERDEIKQWGHETWFLTKKIFPILLIGVV
ncbi:MAG: permease, partial [Thermoplasmata archaeon]|nr:permease [Thermoplasmata archaeon]